MRKLILKEETMKPVLLILLILLVGCSPTASIDSLPDAKKLANSFFEGFKKGNYNDLLSLYSDDFWKDMPKETWKKILPNVNYELGNIKECELISWNQKTQASTSGTGNFVTLQYTCKHEKYDSTITFSTKKPLSGGETVIVGQNFSSIGFLIE